jgi:hypothetical protein
MTASRHVPPPTPQVEAHFIASGYLLPAFHTSYWLGLRARTWGTWQALDQQLPGRYLNWGAGQPNGRALPELCVVAANTPAANGGWGYADVACSGRYVFMCRLPGGGRVASDAVCCTASVWCFHQWCSSAYGYDAPTSTCHCFLLCLF